MPCALICVCSALSVHTCVCVCVRVAQLLQLLRQVAQEGEAVLFSNAHVGAFHLPPEDLPADVTLPPSE